MPRGRKKTVQKEKETSNACICYVNGQRYTTQERNTMMKLEFVNGGLTLQELADKYNLSYDTVADISSKEKWGKARKQLLADIDKAVTDKTFQVYAACGVDVTLQYNQAWSNMMKFVQVVTANPFKYFMDAHGNIKVNQFKTMCEAIALMQDAHSNTTGFIPNMENIKIELQRATLDFRKQMAGEGEEDVIEDNFVEALTIASQSVWEDDLDDEDDKEYQE